MQARLCPCRGHWGDGKQSRPTSVGCSDCTISEKGTPFFSLLSSLPPFPHITRKCSLSEKYQLLGTWSTISMESLGNFGVALVENLQASSAT